MIGQKRLKFGGIPNYSPDIFQCEQTKNLMKMEALQKSLSQLNEFGKKEHDGAGESPAWPRPASVSSLRKSAGRTSALKPRANSWNAAAPASGVTPPHQYPEIP